MNERKFKQKIGKTIQASPEISKRINQKGEKLKFKARGGKIYVENSQGKVLHRFSSNTAGAQNLTVSAGPQKQGLTEWVVGPRIQALPTPGKDSPRIQTTQRDRKPDLRDAQEKLKQKLSSGRASQKGLKIVNSILNRRLPKRKSSFMQSLLVKWARAHNQRKGRGAYSADHKR